MVNYMKTYSAKRVRFIDSQLLAGYRPPARSEGAPPGSLDLSAATVPVKLQSPPENSQSHCRWRLAEITDPSNPFFNRPSLGNTKSNPFGNRRRQMPKQVWLFRPDSWLPGHIYRIRARWQDARGSWSRWSAPAQFTVPARTP